MPPKAVVGRVCNGAVTADMSAIGSRVVPSWRDAETTKIGIAYLPKR